MLLILVPSTQPC